MKRFSSIALLAVSIAIITAVLLWQLPSVEESPLDAATDSDSQSTDSSAVIPPAVDSPVVASLPRPADAVRSRVTHVHDGDTLYLQPQGTAARSDEIKVRLIGIDTPELRPEVECFGTEARDYLRSLAPQGASVWVKPDVEEFDQFGRSLLYLWTDSGHSINLELVKNGYATALNIAPSNTYWKQFDLAEHEAQSARAGLWGSC